MPMQLWSTNQPVKRQQNNIALDDEEMKFENKNKLEDEYSKYPYFKIIEEKQ